jgi:asparagine synthase (glutamine-hydrolysing)
VRKALENAHLSGDERLIAYFNWCNPARVGALTGSSTDLAQPLADALSLLPDGLSRLERMLYLEKRFFLADHNLSYTDRASMRHGVEVRVPFLDPDLVDFAASIPASLKVHRREPKWIFKRSMEGVLPQEIIWRPKTGFGGPLGKWLRGPLRPWLQDQLNSQTLTGLADGREAQRLVGELDRGSHEGAYNLFVLASASAWLGSLG